MEKGSEKTAAAFWTSGDFKYNFANTILLLLNAEDVVSHPVEACKNSKSIVLKLHLKHVDDPAIVELV